MPLKSNPTTEQSRRHNNETIANALRKTGGNVAAAAQALGYERAALHRRITATPGLRDVLEQERETLVDVAESMLLKKVYEGDMTAVMYTLNNSPAAKRRGWGPRQEVTGADGGPLRIEFVNDWRTNSD